MTACLVSDFSVDLTHLTMFSDYRAASVSVWLMH